MPGQVSGIMQTLGMGGSEQGNSFEKFLRDMGINPQGVDPGQLSQLYAAWSQGNPKVIDARGLMTNQRGLPGQRTSPFQDSSGSWVGGTLPGGGPRMGRR